MRSKLTFIAVLGAAFMLAPFAIDMYLPALPTIAADLNTGIDQMEATVSILLFGYALGQLVLGPLSDTFGRRNVLISGLITYVVASVLAGTAQSIEQLYVWRFFQALGGAGSVVVFPMVRDRFDEAEGAKIISYIMAMTIIAPLIAPIIGGYVLVFSGWPAIFFLLAAFGVAIFLGTVTVIAENGSPRKPLSLGSALSGYASVLKRGRILACILTGSFAFAGLFAFVAGSPFVYITHFGIDPQLYGYLVGLNAVAMIGANRVNAQLLGEIEPEQKMLAGAMLLMASGLALLIVAVLGLGVFWIIIAVVAFVGALGLTATNAIVAALSILPEENGTVSALNGAAQFAIGAGSSLLVSLAASSDAVPMAMVMAGCSILALIAASSLKFIPLAQEESHA